VFPELVRRASTTGIRRGLAGSKVWVVIGVVAVGIRILMRMAESDQQVLYRTLIKDGDVFEIVTRAPSPKRKSRR
jgi:hypothetical protein